MTQTATIYYHRPRVKRAGLYKEMPENSQFALDRVNAGMELSELRDRLPASDRATRTGKNVALPSCNVSVESIFNCSANTLRSLGLTGKYDGFMYICRAIEEILKYEESPHFQSIYYDIGKEYDVNRCSVERSIRYAIGYIRRNGNFPKLSTIFGEAVADDKNFSNSKFLTILAADVYEKLTSLELA